MRRLRRRTMINKLFKPNSFISKVWLLLVPFHKQLYLISLLSVTFETVRLAGPFLFGKILDMLIKTGGALDLKTGLAIIGGLVGVRFVSLVIDYVLDILIVTFLWKAERHVSSSSFNKLLDLSIDYHEKENTGAKINIVNKGRDRLLDLMMAYTWEFQPTVIQLFVTCIIMIWVNWIVGAVFSLSLIPVIIITFIAHRATKTLRAKRHDLYEITSGEVGDTLTNITVVKAFAQEKREQASYQSFWDTIRNISSKEYWTHIFSSLGKSFFVEIFYITIMLIGIFEIQKGNLTVGSLVFLITLLEMAYTHVYRLGRIYERAADSSEAVNRITNLMGKTPTIKNSPGATRVPAINGKVSFKHVTFAYTRRRVLKNVSFTIPAGSFTALVGKSGSGKSTIAKLLSRYYDPISGSIIIDGIYDLRDINLDNYRRLTAVVFQDSPVPNRRIWEVIAYSAGQTEFSKVKDQVVSAAKLAHAHEFINEFEDGYETKIGERGVKLSGGQKQRVAIARALFAQPKILIMDEPTSHLDTVSEAMIQKALEDISKERTMTKIVIAHRLSTVQKADQILVMEKGKLVERGTHSQLLRKGGVYSEIVAQSELKR